ncbi:MAG: hypothetical protein DI556_10540 [Rhodovulum sulfidophilum]|uniref:Flagellar hook-length control protein-like C-terminal domain-containing protein n=1 Tax=Rhodovulum sulfidophilum TaxID=35806 RepID=A0A2W5Q599_RHOSU|nr:MAG: hypothetical protein DI556_10540 [Rhodovulum sulfidophilum]
MNAPDLGFLGPARQARSDAARDARLDAGPAEAPAPPEDFARMVAPAGDPPRRPEAKPPAAPAAAEGGIAPFDPEAPALPEPAAPAEPGVEAAPEGAVADDPAVVTPEALPGPPPLDPPPVRAAAGEGGEAAATLPEAFGSGPEAPRAATPGAPGPARAPAEPGPAASAASAAGADAPAAPFDVPPERSARGAPSAPDPARETAPEPALTTEAAAAVDAPAPDPGGADPFGVAPPAVPAGADTDPAAAPARAQIRAAVDPRAVLGQITVALSAGDESRLEIRLDPAELGRVRIALARTERGLRATVSAERPETMELLRRNADALTRELAAAGFGSVSLDMSTRGDDFAGAREPPGGRRFALAAPEVSASAPGGAAPPLRAGDGPLDIRL